MAGYPNHRIDELQAENRRLRERNDQLLEALWCDAPDPKHQWKAKIDQLEAELSALRETREDDDHDCSEELITQLRRDNIALQRQLDDVRWVAKPEYREPDQLRQEPEVAWGKDEGR